MKKSIISLLLLMGFLSVSCKEQKDSLSDIYGQYTFSHAADAFYGVVEDDFHLLCDDAVVTIAKDEEHGSSMKINCSEAGFTHCFHGSLFREGNDSIISMSDCGEGKYPPNCWDVLVKVMREDGKVRLIGCLIFTSGTGGTSYSCNFDVIKN